MNYNFSDRVKNLKPSAIREIFKYAADPEVISFSAGNPSSLAFPAEEIAQISNKILNNSPVDALQYSLTEGYTPLRNFLKTYLNDTHKIGRDFDDLIVTTGAQQVIDLFTKVMCNEGDVVVCENPSFVGALNCFRSHSTIPVGVDIDDDGINLENLEQTLKNNKNAKFIYTIPNFQNPSGITMSLEKRKAVYELAKKYNVLILEDNPYGDLRFEGDYIPTIKSLDTDGIVVYVGSFSKVLSPGMRVGYVCADSNIIKKMVVCKQTNDVHTNIWAQLVAFDFISNYDFNAHLDKLRKIYLDKMTLTEKTFNEFLAPKGISYIKPQGGLFIWCKLPDYVNMMDYCKKAVLEKVCVVPGTAFLADENQISHHFRINFSAPSDDDIVKGFEILSNVDF